jgi:hypothetical protein
MAGSRAISGRSVGQTMGELATYAKVAGGLAVAASAYQSYDAYSHGDAGTGTLSAADGVMEVLPFVPGADVASLGYFGSRLVGDISLAAVSDPPVPVLTRMGILQKAGCL